jgi:hypothetical protein
MVEFLIVNKNLNGKNVIAKKQKARFISGLLVSCF